MPAHKSHISRTVRLYATARSLLLLLLLHRRPRRRGRFFVPSRPSRPSHYLVMTFSLAPAPAPALPRADRAR